MEPTPSTSRSKCKHKIWNERRKSRKKSGRYKEEKSRFCQWEAEDIWNENEYSSSDLKSENDKEISRKAKRPLRKDKKSLREYVESLREDVESLREDDKSLREYEESLRKDVKSLREDVESLREDDKSLREDVESLSESEESLREDVESSRVDEGMMVLKKEEKKYGNIYTYHFYRSTIKEEINDRKLYTYNFHRSTNPGDLKKFFSKFGKVQEACIRKSNVHKQKYTHFAFVIFENAEAAGKAVDAEPSQLELNDHTLQVRYAKSKKKLGFHDKEIYEFPKKEVDKSVKKVNTYISRINALENYEVEDSGCATGEGNYKINDLNDDCLFVIFSFISIKDRIRLELVCKRWRRVLLDQWMTVNKLEFQNKHPFGKLTDKKLHGILQRCGMSLLKLDLPQYHRLRRNTVGMIATFCKQLEHLSIQNLLLTASDVQHLTTDCKNLRSVVLKRPLYQRYQIIQQILEKLPLESFGFLHKHDKCKFLSSLPPTLKHLELNSCVKLEVSCLLSGLSQATNLQSFGLSRCLGEVLHYVELYSKISNIEELSLTQIGTLPHPHFQLITGLQNLRKLSLKCSCFLNDELLACISKECKKLEFLDISVCDSHQRNLVSDLGIKMLAKHSNIKDLSLGRSDLVTDDGLYALANAGKLKKLRCLQCTNVTDVGCSQFLSLCLDLELLDLGGCRKITNVVIASALSTINLRPENKILTLNVYGTRIIFSNDIPVPSRSLKVVNIRTSRDCSDPMPKRKKKIIYRHYRPRRWNYSEDEWYY